MSGDRTADQHPNDLPPAPSGSSVRSRPDQDREASSHSMAEPLQVSMEDQKTVISRKPAAVPPIPRHPTRAAQVADQLLGEQLGHFVLEEFIGGGGMGAVFRATDTALGRTVAIKVVSDASHDEEVFRRFKNEAQSAARLDHPNIARVYYVGAEKGWHYIVFEYVQGVNLRDLVAQRGPLPIEEAILYTYQVAEALDHASQRDVVHRDIKPSNVLVTATGTVKLVDMGLARLQQVETTDELTASGVTLGTFDYISPEQARDPRQADVRSDLYSLGCTLYFMLTGRPPFPEGTVLQKLLSHSSEPPPDPRQFRKDLPDALAEIVLKLLAKNPADRYQTPAELMAQLALVADQLGIPLGAKPTVVVAPLPAGTIWRHTVPWMVATLVIIVVSVVLGLAPGNQPVVVSLPSLPVAKLDSALSANDAGGTQSAGPAASSQRTEGEQAGAGDNAVPAGELNRTPVQPADRGATPSASLDPNANKTGDIQPRANQEGSATTGRASPTSPATSESLAPVGTVPESASRPPIFDATSSSESVASSGSPQVNAEPSVPTTPQTATPPAKSQQPPLTGPKRIIVSPVPIESPADAVVVTSWGAALDQAAQTTGVEAIELWFDGPLEVRAQRLTIAERLEIRAGDGFRPVLWFRPHIGLFASETHLMVVHGGNLVWKNIDVVLSAPPEPMPGWTLFALEDAHSFQLVDSTFTFVDNLATRPEPNCLVQLLPPRMRPPADVTMPLAATMQLPPNIRFERVAVRGPVIVLNVPVAQPLEFSWQQGLLISSARLLQIGGTADRYNWDAEWQVKLDHVTAAIEQGLAAVALENPEMRLLDGNLELNDCVLMTAHDAPLLEYRGVDSFEQAEKALRYRGDRNFYPTRMSAMMGMGRPMRRVRWRIVTMAGQVREFGFDEKDAEWYEEKSAKESVLWKELPPAFTDVPPYRQVRAQYELDTSARNPARAAGFDPSQLRDFPPIPREMVRTPVSP
ncbi:MAG: hypothetical protein KatS3mg109_1864 [Pirellulaceae bacterium]|nr:MAG: hypothetical protein KatS3mg109_1864 [Pirellulaceae bacterium]GIW94009.1 MAG: hypothetical protein KatS3mg110_2050 [Pirellulaceae bacterium]